MRKVLTLLLMILALCFLALPGMFGQASRASGDEPFPCDPLPKEIRLCQASGGVFNYATCRCEHP
jgi:hypothetical protein